MIEENISSQLGISVKNVTPSAAFSFISILMFQRTFWPFDIRIYPMRIFLVNKFSFHQNFEIFTVSIRTLELQNIYSWFIKNVFLRIFSSFCWIGYFHQSKKLIVDQSFQKKLVFESLFMIKGVILMNNSNLKQQKKFQLTTN